MESSHPPTFAVKQCNVCPLSVNNNILCTSLLPLKMSSWNVILLFSSSSALNFFTGSQNYQKWKIANHQIVICALDETLEIEHFIKFWLDNHFTFPDSSQILEPFKKSSFFRQSHVTWSSWWLFGDVINDSVALLVKCYKVRPHFDGCGKKMFWLHTLSR